MTEKGGVHSARARGEELSSPRGRSEGLESTCSCEEGVDVLRVQFFQQWRLGVDDGERTVSVGLRRRRGLLQLLGTLLVPQLSWGARTARLLHLHLSFFLLLLSFSRISPLNLSVYSLPLV